MHDLLTKLGVSTELQAFFDLRDLCFSYGDEQEIYGPGFHHVPVSSDLWMSGKYPATELIISSSAMEAIAYMALNAWRHPADGSLSFIAVGLRPQPEQLRWINRYCLKRKITLVFPNDLCGRLADIVIAAGIRGRPVRPFWNKGNVQLRLKTQTIELPADKISLNMFEKAASLRTGIRTRKPVRFDTFLDQLRYDNEQ
ncbi:hypothetical protein LJ707_02060 [Mucilaginibacter sp. UR6-1]|uniref:hypothetical protein n=1 Tax=Mucilaginibacter sp. UR6-1 TaxID=1435643 RepID=UPI001E627680|nr:hypothetical protein [Mucilaginibacter sp. UR6-1]MCC8407695.1 hypothetical protein [Mucilaginibacter sp. UR6-1]